MCDTMCGFKDKALGESASEGERIRFINTGTKRIAASFDGFFRKLQHIEVCSDRHSWYCMGPNKIRN